jgi:adenylosuccinate lyase
MNNTSLNAISPLDGRYSEKLEDLRNYFSESALFKYRILIEIEYFIELSNTNIPQLKSFNNKELNLLRNIYKNLTEKDAERIKEIEKTTNHDIKAVEYFIKEKLKKTTLEKKLEFIHFGLTSQDINNTSVPLLVMDSIKNEYIPELSTTIKELNKLAKQTKHTSMLARTHGQVASPTTLGKEIYVFVKRLEIQLEKLAKFEYVGKFGGATGNFNAHNLAYPEIKWDVFANKFLKRLKLKRNPITTQIDSYDNIAELCDILRRINTIIIDLDRDIWQYISMNYFKQKTIKSEIGSSAMPHKVNPIDFENSEGNLGIANSIFIHLSSKLPISRLQRDLTDSTVLRNIGVPISHSILAFKSLQKGLSKLETNKEIIKEDLDNHWEVIAEAIQTILRREGYKMPYEALKELTRGKVITKEIIHQFIENLEVSKEIKAELKKISPENYIGIASDLVH